MGWGRSPPYSGFAKKPLTLDVLNGFMGFMSAAAVPPAQGMLGIVYDKPSKRKNAAFACFAAGNPLGLVFGMIFSGIATQLFGWRASFWLLSIIYAIIAIIAFFIVPIDTTEKTKLSWDVWKRFDVVGVILTIAGTGMFSAALSLASDAPNGWKTGYVLAFLVVGVACIIAFVFWELYYDDPLIPMGIFKDRNFSHAFPTANFWISLYIQRDWKANALKTAVYLLPMAIGGLAVNVVAALVLHRVSNKLLVGIGAISYTLAFLLYALNKTSYSYWAMLFPGMIGAVIGADFQANVTNMYVISSLSKSQQSIAGGLFQTVTKLCVTIGMAISTAIFDGVSMKPRGGFHSGDPIQPYSAVFWFSTACAGLSILIVPWLTIGTQGHASTTEGEATEKKDGIIELRKV
ncbi:MFS general substrate transporter [Tothia fuscella]|uniref:MFS general substrate transporter n=1 Tax=Tothia fuscella TaxID=1048955 RepID=A0A9P4TWJ2_9PEZI|nr:MFS general substrate transporter [Tothia fuscella]